MLINKEINAIINEYSKYSPFHGNGLTNHLPMAQFALHKMGVTNQGIREYSEAYIRRWHVLDPHEHPTIEIKKITDELGNFEAYMSYAVYFLDRISREDPYKVVKEVLNTLYKGLASALFHGIIRLAYAVEADNHIELAHALAFFASVYKETRFAEREIPINDLHKELLCSIPDSEVGKKDHPVNHFYIEGDVKEKEQALAEALAELYTITGSFAVLHTVTGIQALLLLKPLFNNYGEVFDRYTVCVQRALLRVSKEDFKKINLDHSRTDWDEIFHAARSVEDAHTIKLAYSCYKLDKIFENSTFAKAANIKLKLDHNL